MATLSEKFAENKYLWVGVIVGLGLTYIVLGALGVDVHVPWWLLLANVAAWAIIFLKEERGVQQWKYYKELMEAEVMPKHNSGAPESEGLDQIGFKFTNRSRLRNAKGETTFIICTWMKDNRKDNFTGIIDVKTEQADFYDGDLRYFFEYWLPLLKKNGTVPKEATVSSFIIPTNRTDGETIHAEQISVNGDGGRGKE